MAYEEKAMSRKCMAMEKEYEDEEEAGEICDDMMMDEEEYRP